MIILRKYKKIPIMLLIFLGIGLGIKFGVTLSKSISLAFDLAKWQKEIILGSSALFLLVPILYKFSYRVALSFDNEIGIGEIAILFLHCVLLGIMFYVLLSSIGFFVVYLIRV